MDFTLKGGSWCISQALYGHNMAILVREGLKMNCCDSYNPVHNATERMIKITLAVYFDACSMSEHSICTL